MPFVTPEDSASTQTSIFPSEFNPPQENIAPEYYQQKAVTTGLATAPQGTDIQGLEDHIDATQGKLEMGLEGNINTNLAYDQQSQDKISQQNVIKDSIINNDADTFKDVSNIYVNTREPSPVATITAPARGAANNLQSQAANENAVQAKAQEELTPQGLVEANQMFIKRSLIQDAINKNRNKIESQSLFSDFTDFLGASLPLVTENALTGNVAVHNHTPDAFTGTQTQDETAALMGMDLNNFVNYGWPAFQANLEKNTSALGTNPHLYELGLEHLLDYSQDNATVDNLMSAADHTIVLGTGFRLLRSLSRALLTQGAAVSSHELMASKLLYGDSTTSLSSRSSPLTKYITQNDMFTDLSHSGFVPNYELVGTNAPTAVNAVIDRNEAITDRINQIQRTPFLDSDQQKIAMGRTKADISERIAPQGLTVADTHMVSQPNSATTQIGVKIGKTDGTGWATKENARAAIERSGYGVDDFEYTKGLDNQHYPVLKTTVSGNGLTAPADIDKLTGGGVLGPLKKFLINTDATDLPALERVKTKGAYTQANIEARIYQPLLRPASELSGKSQNVLAKIINLNMDKEVDLDPVEFRSEWKRLTETTQETGGGNMMTIAGKYPTDKEMSAYYSLRQANAVSFALDNRRVYEDYAINGYKDIEFNQLPLGDDGFAQKIRARRVEGLNTKGSTRIYNASSNETLPINSINPSQMVDLKEEGYHLFEVEDMKQDGGPVTHVLSKSPDYTQYELSPHQLNYKPGTIGPRIYQKGYYLKQVLTHMFEDGIQYRGKDMTLFHSRNITDLQEYAGRWNKALDAFREYKAGKLGVPETEEILGKNTQFETVQDFQKAIDDGMFTEHPMQVVRDGERPKFGSPSIANELHTPQDLNDFTIHAYQQGRLITSPRGERLTDIYGEKAPVLDVYSSVGKAASTAIRHTAFDVYKKNAIDKWYATASELQVLKDPKAGGTYNIFDADPYTSDIKPDVKSKLETMRMSIRRTLGQQTISQRAFSDAVEHLGNWIETLGDTGKAFAPKLYDIQSANPVAALRGFIFHKTLGMFNPAQLIMQPSTMVMAVSAHPIYGVNSVFALPYVRLATINGNDTVLDYLSKLEEIRLGGMAPKEFKLYIKELKASGIADNSTHLAVNDYTSGVSISQSKANLGVKDIAAAGQMFFNEGNKINQLVSYGIAWRKAKAEFGLANITSPEARNYIASEVTKLAVSMKSTSAAFWQKGLLSYPTQFAGYTERMLNAIAPAFLGGDKRFTGWQKTRIFAGQALLFGKYGVPVYGISDAAQYAFGIKKEDADKMQGGIADHIASEIFGTDVSYSERVGVTENVRQLLSNVQEQPFATVMGGATYEGTSNFIKQLRSAVNLTTVNSLENEHINTWDRMSAVMAMAEQVFTNNISSMSNSQKALGLYNYGKFLSNTGRTVVVKPELIHDHLSALAVALSIPLSGSVEANDLYQTNSELKETEKTLTNHISPFTEAYIDAASKGDYQEMQRISDKIHIMGMVLPENLQQRANVLKAVWKRPNQVLLKQEQRENIKLQGQPTPSGYIPAPVDNNNNQ